MIVVLVDVGVILFDFGKCINICVKQGTENDYTLCVCFCLHNHVEFM